MNRWLKVTGGVAAVLLAGSALLLYAAAKVGSEVEDELEEEDYWRKELKKNAHGDGEEYENYEAGEECKKWPYIKGGKSAAEGCCKRNEAGDASSAEEHHLHEHRPSFGEKAVTDRIMREYFSGGLRELARKMQDDDEEE